MPVAHDRLKVALVSSILPADAAGGEVVLHRHLCTDQAFDLTIVDGSGERRAKTGLVQRVLARLQKTRLAAYVQDYWVFREGRWLDGDVRLIDKKPLDVVLTVAHGDAFCVARRLAKKRNLPLVSIYHDWWPDIPHVHAYAKRRLEQQFRQLAADSTRVLCVSEGMHEALGGAANSSVLYPLPDTSTVGSSRSASHRSGPYRVGYMGNLFTYGPMLQEAIEESWEYPDIKIEVRGSHPEWPPEFRSLARERGNWLDFAERDVLHDWLESLDAFLVTMDFTPAMRRRMETSFPSKLTEFAKYGKPIIVWGPDYSSAVRWNEATRSALAVCSRESAVLLAMIGRLVADSSEQARLGQAALRAFSGEFEPVRTQEQFRTYLGSKCSRSEGGDLR